jgi:tetratricopeptide (TPR) repeat protein
MPRFPSIDVRRSALQLFVWPALVWTVVSLLTAPAFAQDIPDDFGPPIVKAKPVYFAPEHFPNTDEWETFRIHALEFVQKYPDDVMAPRAISDLIAIETVRSKPNLVQLNGYKTRLVLEYPESLATAVTIKSIKDQNEYRTLLINEFRKLDQSFDPDFCRQYVKACELGLNAYGPGFVNDDSFAQIIELVLNDGKSFRLKQICEQKFLLVKGLPKVAMEVCRNTELTTSDKVLKLHALLDSLDSKHQTKPLGPTDAERFWLARLSPDEQKLPAIRAILIEKLLALKKFPQALAELTELLAVEQQPKWIFWQAWALACEQQFDASLDTLEQLSKQFPKDPWNTVGTDFAFVLRDRETALHENIDAILELAAAVQGDNFDTLKVNFSHHPLNSKAIDAWITADSINYDLDVFINYGGKPLVGYKATLKDYSIFLRDQAKIVQINKPGIFPDLNVAMTQSPLGLTPNFNFNTASTPAAAASWRRLVQELAKNPLVANKLVISNLIRFSIKTGFPRRMQTVEGRRIFGWFSFEFNRPEVQKFEVELAGKDQHQLQVRFGSQTSAEILFGKAGSLAADTRWKDLPIVKKEEFDLALMMQAIALATSIINPEANAESPPASPAAVKDGSVIRTAAEVDETSKSAVKPIDTTPK